MARITCRGKLDPEPKFLTHTVCAHCPVPGTLTLFKINKIASAVAPSTPTRKRDIFTWPFTLIFEQDVRMNVREKERGTAPGDLEPARFLIHHFLVTEDVPLRQRGVLPHGHGSSICGNHSSTAGAQEQHYRCIRRQETYETRRGYELARRVDGYKRFSARHVFEPRTAWIMKQQISIRLGDKLVLLRD